MDNSVINKKINKQMDYIYSELKNFSFCRILKDSYKHQVEKVSTPIVKNILNNKYSNGADMDAVLCLFNNLFISSAKFKENGLFHLSVHISKWLKKLTLINTKSASGFVFFSDILSDIEVIIKIPKYKEDYDDMIREYFIGATEINKLRYIIPTFVYTIGAFICPISEKLCHSSNEYDSSQLPFVIFEKIPGDNIQKMLVNNKLSFEEYLGIFIQVLLSLEVAQREIGFCHFDFHCGNLMCRKLNKNRQYSVPIDNYLYKVNAQKFLPVIIDFGLSTVKYKNIVIGSHTFPEYGMKHYMLQGVDMFKILVYSCTYSSGDLQRQIINLLSFYGEDDPYQILVEGEIGIDEAVDEYVKEGSYSRITTQTPLMFLNWIISNPEYNNITDKYIHKVDRNLLIPLKFSTTVETYDNMFQNPDQGRKNAIQLVNRCVFTEDSSYILSKYSVLLLNGYNNTLHSDQLKKDITKINEHITNNKKNMIKNDQKMLLNYKDIKIPNIIKIKDYYSRILNIRINSKKIKHKKQEVLQLINIYFTNIKFFFDILPYLQLLYTIKEIKRVEMYKTFISSFTKSEHYLLYIQNNIEVNRAYRWSHTLLDKIQ